jgi:hypothetical protein
MLKQEVSLGLRRALVNKVVWIWAWTAATLAASEILAQRRLQTMNVQAMTLDLSSSFTLA